MSPRTETLQLLWEPVPVLGDPHSNKVFPGVQTETPSNAEKGSEAGQGSGAQILMQEYWGSLA